MPPFGKWAMLVALGCSGAAVLALPFPKAPSDTAWRPESEQVRTERNRLRGASMVLDEAVSDVRALQAEARAVAAARHGTAITIDPSVPAILRAALDSLAREAWTALGHEASSRWAGLVLHFDSGGIELARRVPESRRNADLFFVLPAPETGGRCLAVVRLRRPERAALPRAERLLGPCAFYARFGAPGAAVEGWLRAGNYAFARSVHRSGEAAEPRAESASPLLLPAAAARCLNGRDVRCETALALAAPTGARRAEAGRPGDAATRARRTLGPLSANPSEHGDTLGAREARFLSDMAAELGADRFGAFWTSAGEDVRAAFADATGIPLDEWTRRWLERASGPRTARMLPDRANLLWLALVIPLFTMGALRRREHVMWGGRPGRG